MEDTEKIILKEFVKDPRISDNQIALKTNIPVKTVNRKRKSLEEKGILSFYTNIDHEASGTFGAKKMYIILFKYGISRQMFIDKLPNFGFEPWEKKHINQIMFGEHNGRFALTLIVESRVNSDLLEIFNIEIIGKLKRAFGEDFVYETLVFPIEKTIKVHHNYPRKDNDDVFV